MAAQAAAAPASSKYQPSDFLKAVLGRPVVVKLNSGVAYRGVLACLDGYMNIARPSADALVGIASSTPLPAAARSDPRRVPPGKSGEAPGSDRAFARAH